MKTANNMVAQGDVLMRRVESLPEGAQPVQVTGRIVIAKSETHHDHAIEASPMVHLFSTGDPFVSYLCVDAEYADVVHHRAWDTHESIRLLKGTWEVRRQREWTPEGYRRVED